MTVLLTVVHESLTKLSNRNPRGTTRTYKRFVQKSIVQNVESLEQAYDHALDCYPDAKYITVEEVGEGF